MDGRDSVLLVCNVCAQDPTSYTRYFMIKIHHCAAHITYYNLTCLAVNFTWLSKGRVQV